MRTRILPYAAMLALVCSACGRSVEDYTYAEWYMLDEEQQWELYGQLDGHEAMMLYGQSISCGSDTINPDATIGELLDRGRDIMENQKARLAKKKAEAAAEGRARQ
jgi:hypothetical protein